MFIGTRSLPSVFLFFFSLLSARAVSAADYTNSIGMQFNNIAPGTFFMGSCVYSNADREAVHSATQQDLSLKDPPCPDGVEPDRNAHEAELPRHEVEITEGFQIGVYEVTFGQFKQYLAALASDEREKIETEQFKKSNSHGDDSAVTAVSWEDTRNFISWLNRKEGGEQYRLPTEAEWEYAARAGTTSIYFWGDTVDPAPDYAWFNMKRADLHKWFPKGELGRKENFPHPVGLKKPNSWGLYDMAGNVWEWVNDRYSAVYYQNSPMRNPEGPEKGRVHCFRGGSWYGSVKNLRSAFRGLNAPDFRSDSLGFRLVRQPNAT